MTQDELYFTVFAVAAVLILDLSATLVFLKVIV